MPGLTKVATSDQPDSIVSEIEEMARAGAYTRPRFS
jgi:hypothetical protein